MSSDVINLPEIPIHLGRGATIEPCEPFDGTMEWFARYDRSTADDGGEGRLVTWHTFSGPWDSWEMHPRGHELVVCVAGTITLHQEVDGAARSVSLTPGQAAINDPGVWHTADVDGTATAMFVTHGRGTEHRPR